MRFTINTTLITSLLDERSGCWFNTNRRLLKQSNKQRIERATKKKKKLAITLIRDVREERPQIINDQETSHSLTTVINALSFLIIAFLHMIYLLIFVLYLSQLLKWNERKRKRSKTKKKGGGKTTTSTSSEKNKQTRQNK